MEIKAGTVVISLAGRDKGKPMAVLNCTEKAVLIADGKERKLEKPKSKNKKHVKATHKSVELEGLTDKKLRQTLRALFPQGESAGFE